MCEHIDKHILNKKNEAKVKSTSLRRFYFSTKKNCTRIFFYYCVNKMAGSVVTKYEMVHRVRYFLCVQKSKR